MRIDLKLTATAIMLSAVSFAQKPLFKASVATENMFAGVNYSKSFFEDIDNDNDLDIFITGISNDGGGPKFYLNNGSGGYSESSIYLDFTVEDCDFADYNNDGYVDLMVIDELKGLTKLYENDKKGGFAEVLNTPFENLVAGCVKFEDIDNDSDYDVYISGLREGGSTYVAHLYINDGTGNYALKEGNNFITAVDCAIEFADIDNDGDKDLYITGCTNRETLEAQVGLYLNDGNGLFTEKDGDLPFDPLLLSSASFSDLNNDGAVDLFVSGVNNSSWENVADLFMNDGAGNFTKHDANSFTAVSYSSFDIADFDNDMDNDIILIGNVGGISAKEKIAKLYINNGNANFTEAPNTPFLPVGNGSVCSGDIDQDSDLDLLFTGEYYSNESETVIAKLFVNQRFTMSKVAKTVCDSLLWIDGNVYHESNDSILYTTQNIDGNDSIILLDLTVNKSVTTDTVAESCGSFEWYGEQYSESGMYRKSFQTVNGCDSTIILNLTVNEVPYRTDVVMVCDSLVWIDGNVYKENNSEAAYIVENSNGCDSLVYLDLTVYQSKTIDTVAESCGLFEWYGEQYSESGIYHKAFQTVNGCDSTIILNLAINNPSFGTDVLTACDSLVWIDGNVYKENNSEATYIVENSNGCDSVVHLDLTVYQSKIIDTVAESCGLFEWYGEQYSESGIYHKTFQTVNGCDSVVHLDLTVHQSKTTDTVAELMGSFEWYGEIYTESGRYNKTFQTVNGCDSVVVLNLTIADIVGINNIEDGSLPFDIYPNPIRKSLFVNLGTENAVDVKIIDNNGRVVNDGKYVSNSELRIEGKDGVYFIEFTIDNDKYLSRVLKVGE